MYPGSISASAHNINGFSNYFSMISINQQAFTKHLEKGCIPCIQGAYILTEETIYISKSRENTKLDTMRPVGRRKAQAIWGRGKTSCTRWCWSWILKGSKDSMCSIGNLMMLKKIEEGPQHTRWPPSPQTMAN